MFCSVLSRRSLCDVATRLQICVNALGHLKGVVSEAGAKGKQEAEQFHVISDSSTASTLEVEAGGF